MTLKRPRRVFKFLLVRTVRQSEHSTDGHSETGKHQFENYSKRRNRRSVEFFPFDTPPEEILETLKELDAEPPIDVYVGDELVAENVTDVSKLEEDDVTATSPMPLNMELMDPIIDKYDGLTTFLPVFPAQSQGFTD